MPRVTAYVDCDDTLVLWLDDDDKVLDGPNPYGTGPDGRWKPNLELLAALKEWRENTPGSEIILWSGGGADWAQLWERRIYPEAADAISKDPRIPGPDDLCIDDDQLKKVACPVVTWQQFVKEWGNEG